MFSSLRSSAKLLKTALLCLTNFILFHSRRSTYVKTIKSAGLTESGVFTKIFLCAFEKNRYLALCALYWLNVYFF